MCQSVQFWCIGCREIRPGLHIQTCEKYDAATNSCVDLKLENPPLRPHLQYCDNLKCKYLDPALVWHPDRPLSPESQVFADRLKDAVKFATALEAARAQADKKVDALGDSESLKAQASSSTTGDTSIASRPQTTTSSMHAATVPESVSRTGNGHSICPEERATQQSSSQRRQAGAGLPQSATSRGVVQKPVHATPSPLPSQGIRQGIISTRATPEPSKLAGTPKPSPHLSEPGHPTSIYGSPSNIFQQAHAHCTVPQLGGPVTPSSIEQRGTGSYATPVNGGLRAPAGMRPAHNQQVLTMPVVNSQPSTSSARARQAMNPGHRAIMEKLLNPNAVLPSRSSRSPSVQHVQHSHQTPKLSATVTPLQSQPAPPARTPQSAMAGINGMSPEVAAFAKSLEAQVYGLHRDHYQPMPPSYGSDHGTMNSGTMTNGTRNNRNLMYQDQNVLPGTNSQQGIPNNYSPFQRALLNQRYTNYPQGHGGGLVGFDAYHAGGQHVSATSSDPWSNPWASAGSQFSQIGQGYPQQQNMNMNPSPQTGAMPMPNSNGIKRSYPEASDDAKKSFYGDAPAGPRWVHLRKRAPSQAYESVDAEWTVQIGPVAC
ncbi:hypothetical protein CH063_06345 [Colletotrichum higginsianum]|uniref:Uncharacterized protein n=2 Tax=Colletotrichum higginsianum TaxID=80884 RepID=H1V271_COLHI|nr:hypothetical protein CH63R_03339 [Colletotrichum higginsianum IMI 349063]OBR14613.1 hypothetical protein CH63R_03339 [Colletotrichum higginsianum IMI 349063]TID02418.1 hypothetical protein CH35J_004713 [Colletotrichum higginsianum]CCF34323.1 hypothetical protein CH063_06345 [Colletotrichum higginsianum]